MAYVREVALKCCPSPLPDAFKTIIPERIRDPHIDVQIAALGLVEKNPLPEWKPAVLEVFGKAEEQWLRRAVDQAADLLCNPLELIELHVGLIDDPNKAKLAVDALSFIMDWSSLSRGTDVDTLEKRQKCKAAWLKFVAENRERLKEKRRFSLKEPVPIADLFPGIIFPAGTDGEGPGHRGPPPLQTPRRARGAVGQDCRELAPRASGPAQRPQRTFPAVAGN